jgi:putative ABC transport system permease protein
MQREVAQLLERRRGARTSEFYTNNVAAIIRQKTGATKTFAILLGTIASISLLVGGVGIMNIMLVSVTERTREIGIRLAVGTKPGDILWQFLVESLVLCIVGGLLGIIVGTGTATLVTYLNGWPTEITLESILLALLCSGAVGIAFGYYPASRAARLEPIEALRNEMN